jgi:glycosyltransferase involved in cell wall biosynthesis
VLVSGRINNPEYQYLLNLDHTHYIYAGEVEDPENYLLAADVFLNPVTEGGGIKVKTMEALGYNLPVISTNHSARGIDLNLTGKKLKVCTDNDWPAFCSLITDAWSEETESPQVFYKQYHWKQVILPFLEKINSL